MKTLKQILLEIQRGELVTATPDELEKILTKSSKDDEMVVIKNLRKLDEIEKIYKFKLPKGTVTIDNKDMDWDKPVDVIRTARSTDGNRSVFKNWAGQPVLAVKAKNNIWYFIILKVTPHTNDMILNIPPIHTIIKKYQSNSYYKLAGVVSAMDQYSTDKETEIDIEDTKKKNRKEWEDWLPSDGTSFYKLDDKNDNIDKIRKLVGLNNKNNKFDGELKKRLQAWQNHFKIPATGEWDTKTQAKYMDIFSDENFKSKDNVIATAAKKVKEIAKIAAADEREAAAKKQAISNKADERNRIIDLMPFKNQAEINNFRTYVINDTDYNKGKTGNDKLLPKGKKTEDFINAWVKYHKAYIDGKHYASVEPVVVKSTDETDPEETIYYGVLKKSGKK